VLDSWLSIVDGSPEHLPEGIASNVNMSTPIPDSFCFDMFFEVVKTLLDYDHFQIVLKTLAFLYMHMDRFYGSKRVRLFNLLLDEELFYSLCLHWHPEVRHTFLYMMVYRLNRRGLPPVKTTFDSVSDKSDKGKLTPFENAVSNLNVTVKEFRDEELVEMEQKNSIEPKDTVPRQRGLFKKIGQKVSNFFAGDKGTGDEEGKEDINSMVAKGDNRHVLIPDEDPSFERCVLVVSYLSLKEMRTEGRLRGKFKTLMDNAYQQYWTPTLTLLPKRHLVYLEPALHEYEKIVPSFKRLQLVHDDPAKNLPGGRLRGRSRSLVGLSSMIEDEKKKHDTQPKRRGSLKSQKRPSQLTKNLESHTRRISRALPATGTEEETIRGQVFLPVFHYQITAEKI